MSAPVPIPSDLLQTSFQVFDYAAVVVFGATGALAAARRGHDIVTFAFFSAATGVGGGTIRDLLIGAPVFWVHQPGILLACLAAAVMVWLFGERPAGYRLLLWLDAVGMAAYTVVGAAKAESYGVSPAVSVVMGVITATFGGIVRDVLAGEPSVLLRREIYVTAALLGAASFAVVQALHLSTPWPAVIGFVVGLAVRGAALRFNLSMPGFKGRGAQP
ncbi:MAG: hypothetical protein JWP35_3023 [Caulobacter sp.]|jgi:uncharacterized membrane protein YeiH|nr:hypothetical protein [Caulobacter sp.]